MPAQLAHGDRQSHSQTPTNVIPNSPPIQHQKGIWTHRFRLGWLAASLATSFALPACSPAGTSGSGPLPPGIGYLHTRGADIVDSSEQVVRLAGLSWFGMETDWMAPHGLDRRSLASMLDQIAGLGYNTLRIPFASQMLDAGSTTRNIDFTKNPELKDKKPIEVLDKIIEGASARSLRIILDRHRPDISMQSNLWYTGAYTEARWISDWQALATRYKGNPTVIGFDLHNEPHGNATWGSGDMATDWRLAAERAGNAIQAINPDLLFFVEGVEQVNNQYYWWGGNLQGAGNNPVRLGVPNHVVYSPHDYPQSVYNQPWFSAPNYPSNLPGVWDSYWGYLANQGTAPIWIGEFGTKYQTDSDKKWLAALVSYIGSKRLSFSFWCWNPNSGDTGGILQDDWTTVNADKQAALAPLLGK